MKTVAFLLDAHWPFAPDLVSSATYWTPPIAIIAGWAFAQGGRNKAAWAVAIAAALIVGWPAPFAARHPHYYMRQEWLIVAFAAVFPLFCVARYVCANTGTADKTNH